MFDFLAGWKRSFGLPRGPFLFADFFMRNKTTLSGKLVTTCPILRRRNPASGVFYARVQTQMLKAIT
jgi:hypothetical protein